MDQENGYPQFDELYSNNNIALCQLLVQATAMLSTTPNYSHMTPSEVYNAIVKHTREVHKYIKEMETECMYGHSTQEE